MTILLAFLIAVPLGVALERKRAKRLVVFSRLPTQLERNPLDTPSVWRQQVARELVFGKARVIEADATEVARG